MREVSTLEDNVFPAHIDQIFGLIENRFSQLSRKGGVYIDRIFGLMAKIDFLSVRESYGGGGKNRVINAVGSSSNP